MMLQGPLVPAIIKYALPLALTGILQQLFNAADVAVVGTFVGKEAMAATGSNAPVIGLLVNLFVGISLGANVVIANASGQGDDDRIKKAVHTSILVAIIAGIVMAVFGEAVSKPVINLLGVPENVYDMALLYLRVYLLGMPVILLYNFESAIFRSRGNTRIPLIALAASGVINVILNLFFVLKLHMTVDGVALATVISNLISSVILFICLLRTKDKIRVSFRDFGIDWPVLKKMLVIGVPSGIQGMVFSLSNIVVQSAINSLGATVMAASSAGFNLEVIAYYVMNSFSQACTTFVGQNFGAGQNDRCREVLKYCLILCFSFTFVVAGLILAFNHPLLSLFNSDEAVISQGLVRLEFIFFAYIFSFAQEVFTGYLRGFGISMVPAVSTVLGVCGTRIIWIIFVFPHRQLFSTIMAVYPISLGLTALFMIIFALVIRPSKRFEGRSL